MSLLRYDAKRDSNEKEIVNTLEKMGLSVYRLDKPLDLLVGYNKRNFLVEVKSGTGTLTEPQKDFIKDWRGQHVIISTVSQATTFANEVRKKSFNK